MNLQSADSKNVQAHAPIVINNAPNLNVFYLSFLVYIITWLHSVLRSICNKLDKLMGFHACMKYIQMVIISERISQNKSTGFYK